MSENLRIITNEMCAAHNCDIYTFNGQAFNFCGTEEYCPIMKEAGKSGKD